MQNLVFGIVTGAYLVVATLGFALVSRVVKFLNIAHAELISAGAFITYLLNARAGWPIILAGLGAVVGVALLSVVVGRLAYWPIRRTSPVVLLITSVGVVYVIHGTIEAIVKPGTYTYDIGAERSIDLGFASLTDYDIAILALAAISVVALHLLLTRTGLGLRLRALASDEQLAAGRGIEVGRATTHVWLVAGALAGLAGVLLGLRGAINTDIAFGQILLILSVSILAGLGSIYGVVVAALLLGIAMDMSTLVIPPGYRDAIAFGVIIVVLIVRPEGLSGAGLRRREA
ncbi:MAG TPA: branched-chain amino acid ABC transporter permease [Solirubrobacter sp.]|nr:branched-chain amino acid ABC transporter permease [Solirubrobacter sp.]